MKKENINYSIGLDIGTNSVGWAVTDDNFNILKKGNKNMWGSRLFDKAETAADRRNSRSIRRRYNKRRERIKLLREIMMEAVLEKDPIFFIRMNEVSFLDDEDKLFFLKDNYNGNYNLFAEDDYNDQIYYDKFPTIYHLRDYLCKTTEKVDPRLIYLALHHIVKYRGNFLYEGQKFSMDNTNKIEDMSNLLLMITEYNNFDFVIDDNLIENMLEILKEKIPRKQKVDRCIALFDITNENKASLTNFITGITGNQFNFTKIILAEVLKSNDNDIKLKFSDATFETKLEEVSNDLGEYLEIINEMQKIYSWIELSGIIKNDSEELSISAAMINRYENHKSDLKCLKKVIKNHDKNIYKELFRLKEEKLNNYYNYIHNPVNTSRELFYKYLLNILTKIDNEEAQYCVDKINNEDFLLKQNDRSNGEVPYQLNLNELTKIIDNQSQYYKCLKNNKNKIISILTFRIPYYYGPLDGNEKFGWLEKKDNKKNERILPWNHEEVVDSEKTATAFIERLTNYCTYLPDQTVMPKKSLTCCMYEVLAELNKIRVDGYLLKKDIKEKIIIDLFMRKKVVKDRDLREWFKKNKVYLNNEELEISGYQKENAFASSLDSWIDFKNIFGEITDSNYQIIEDIIKDLTIFNEGKILKKRITDLYSLTDKQIKKILKLKYSGWSRLSQKLINGIRSNTEYNSTFTILDVMKETNMTLMEIINDEKLGFKKIIEEANYKPKSGGFNYEDVAELSGSPAIKKGIWQALQIIEEITKYMKHQPSNVYIEFAREEGKKQRTTSQVKKLQDIYKNLSLQTSEDVEVRNQLNKEVDNKKLNNDRLYLYYTQRGKCMYCGKSLDIDKLYDNHIYQIDHIIPQSLIKDDSLDNKVLVCASCNQRKLDDLVISFEIRSKQSYIWKDLMDNKLISQRKYFNLMRNEISDKQKEKFINRQIVETRQIVKHVANIINNYYKDTKVNAIRANLTHDFREKYKIYKNRNVNDFHHAHDAYIACVLGAYVKKRYPKLDAKFVYGEYVKLAKKKDSNAKSGFILNSMNHTYIEKDSDEEIWNPDIIKNILKCFNYKDCFVTKKLESNDSLLFKVTIFPNVKNSSSGKTKATIPVNKKRQNVDKYGGFSNVEYVMYAIEGYKKSKLIRKIIGIPLIYQNESIDTKLDYIKINHSIETAKILKEIKKNQLIERDGGFFYLSSATEIVPAWQLILSHYENETVYEINKALKKEDYNDLNPEKINVLYKILINKISTYYPKYESIATKMGSMIDDFMKLSLEEKAYVINQMLNITSAGPQNGNIKLVNFKLGDRLGRLSNQNILLDEILFYNQSVTGLYCSVEKL